MADTPVEEFPEDLRELDATGEFFSVGTPLHAVRAGYVRRRADDMLYEAAIAGRYAHVIAPDRCGKSSLIAATAARLENNGISVAVLDLAQFSVRDGSVEAGRWYYNVAYRLLRQLRIRFDLQTWWQDKAVLNNRQRLLEFYAEVILQNIQQSIVIFVDEIQCVAELPFADQLLASIRSAHNARTTDPDFTRLTFVLLGECDPHSLVDEPEMSPFNATQPVPLDDFTRDDLNLFATELNLNTVDAQIALDRIYHWTSGQPYLSQKLARAIARERIAGDIPEQVDRIVTQQLAGRAALHSEPHMSHIHRVIVESGKNTESLLNLYGKLRKGIAVPADLGSADQRHLMAAGLLVIDESGELMVRNRIYEAVFTTRWANENLPTRWRAPLAAVAAMVILALIPFWYTQWLPNPYVSVLTSASSEFGAAESAWLNLRSFPGHADTADKLFRSFLTERADNTDDVGTISTVATLASVLPEAGTLPQTLLAGFWDRQARTAMRDERRDDAFMASLEALVVSTTIRRNRSAMLAGNDYPLLIASSPVDASSDFVFNPGSLLLTAANGSKISQWSMGADGLSRSNEWTMTALEVAPLVRRVIVDTEGTVRRAGLTLTLSHPRLADLRIKVISPSGKTVEVSTEQERASASEDIRIPPGQLQPLVGETLSGTWSISIRDEATGVAGHLVGWDLTLNSQGLIQDFQRGISIPDPVEQETTHFWIDGNGRYAVARATQSDSARLWDLALAKPIAEIAVTESENLIGVDDGARRLVTATLDKVHLWDTATGNRVATLAVGPASSRSKLTADGRPLFVPHRSDTETRYELWSLATRKRTAKITVAGAPALAAVDASGRRLAIADYDRAVRVWDFESGEMLVQLGLVSQPSKILLGAGGNVLAVIYGVDGLAAWSLASPANPILESFGRGEWELAFSPSGARFVAGRPQSGFQLYDSASGRRIGPAVGAGGSRSAGNLLGISRDDDVIATSGPAGNVRFWKMPVETVALQPGADGHAVWSPSGDSIVVALPDASSIAVGDRNGHVHLLSATTGNEPIAAESEDLSFIGHNDPVRLVTASSDGERLASVGSDNSIRVWNTKDGLPRSFIASLAGDRIRDVQFSSSGALLAVLVGNRVAMLNTDSGDIEVELDLGELHTAMAFSRDDELYVGSQAGELSVIDRDNAGGWRMQRIWTGNAPVDLLEVSPRGRYLVIVDATHEAKLLNLTSGQSGALAIRLPADVEDVVFSPNESRILFSTARWVHKASSSSAGLVWLDALHVAGSLPGARIVFGTADDAASQSGKNFYLPVFRDDGAYLAEYQFSDASGPGLFGSKDELLDSWRRRLAYPAASATE